MGGDVGGRMGIPGRGRHPGPERAALQRGAQVGHERRQRVRQLGVERGQRARRSPPTRPGSPAARPGRRRSARRSAPGRRAPTRCAAQPAFTMAATVWLAAEWVTPVAAASSRTLAGPSASTRTTGENRRPVAGQARGRRALGRRPRPSARTGRAAPCRARGRERSQATSTNSNSAVVTGIDLDRSNVCSSTVAPVRGCREGARDGLEQPADPVVRAGAQLSGRRPAGRAARATAATARPGPAQAADYVAPAGPAAGPTTACPTPSCTATPTSASSTARATRRSWSRRRPGSGWTALALTDHDGFYGVVRFAEAAAAHGVPHGLRRRAVARPARAAERRTPTRRAATCWCWPATPRATAGCAARSARPSCAGGEKGRPVYDLDELAGAHGGPLAGAHRLPQGRGAGRRCADGRPGRAADGELDRAGRRCSARDNVAVELTAPRRPARRRPQRRAGRAGRRRRAARPSPPTTCTTPRPARRRLATALAAVRARRSLDEMDGWLPAAGTAHLRSGAEMAAAVRRAIPGRSRGPPSSATSCAFDLQLVAPQLPDCAGPGRAHRDDAGCAS